jgi:hypothetical protein
MNGIELHDLLAVVRWPGGFGNVGVGVDGVHWCTPLSREVRCVKDIFEPQHWRSTSFQQVRAQR